MKQWKKNLVAAAVLVTVCTGIYLNWLYADQQTTGELTDTLDAEKVMSDELLQEAMAYEDTDKAAESSAQLEDIVQTALSEATIESLIIAKGYSDCVTYMSADGVSVAVAAPEGGLQSDDVAVIADIIMTQSDYTMDDIYVVEVP